MLFVVYEYKTSVNIDNTNELKSFISHNTSLPVDKIIGKKIISNKAYILYEGSNPSINVGVMVLERKHFFDSRYCYYADSYSSRSYNKSKYLNVTQGNEENIVIYYGINKEKMSYYKIMYGGYENKINIEGKYIFDVYLNDERLDFNYISKVFDENGEEKGTF